jgi:excisionase family DNA binding protein
MVEKDANKKFTNWLRESQACQYLGISRTTIYRLKRQEAIAFSQYGRIIRYRMQDLDSFLMGNYQAVHPP